MGLKMPRVTIEFQEDTNYAIGKISPGFVIGFALRLFWPFLAILGEYTFSNEAAAEYVSVLNLASVISFGCTMLAYGVFLKQLRHLFSTPKKRDFNRLLAACVIVLGVALILVSNGQPDIACPILVVAGVLTGIGSAMLMMSYGVSASICDAASVGLSAALAFAIALTLYAITSYTCQNSPEMCCALAAVIPFCEWLCLHESSKTLIDRLEFADMTIPVRMAPFSLHITLPSLLFGIALAVCRLQVMDLSNTGDADMAGAMVLGAVIAGLFIAAAVLTQRQNTNFMTRVLMPLIAAGLLALSIVEMHATPCFAFFFTCFYIFIACSVWVTLSDVSQRFRISAFTVFGFGYGALLIGESIAFAVDAAGGPVADLFLQTPNTTALLFFLLISGMALLPRDSELRSTLKIGRHCPGLNSDSIASSLIAVQSSALQDQANTVRNANETKDAPTPGPRETEEVEKTAAESAPAAEQTEKPNGSNAGKGKEADEGPLGKQGRYKRKCAIVADTYLLSRKETEVLFLLAKGRNAAAIQEALYIAAGTANTHMRHIYRKLDVHSQQELIELVENVEVGDEF